MIESIAGCDALVTGSSRGLGFGVARAFAEAGARVWMIAEVEGELDEAAEEIRTVGGEVETRTVDLTDRRACATLAQEVRSEVPKLRVLVNNAGVLERQAVTDIDLDTWDRTIAVNLTAPMVLCRELAPGLAKTGGSIINVSSRAGTLAFATQAAYCASKFALEGMTRCLALELEGSPVSVNTVTPGLRLKPTSLTRADAAAAPTSSRAEWNDPVSLGPAFLFLAGLRGRVSGCRFDAQVLTQAIETHGDADVLRRIDAFAEHVPPRVTVTP
jgi:NAD(P)-dependent dehydrogenase (short-subunit alcohol dehydrogenase family)